MSMRRDFAGLRTAGARRPGGAHGPVFRADQMPARQVLRGGQPPRGRRDRLRNLFDRRATSTCWSSSTSSPAPTSAISSTRRCRPSRASRTPAPSSPSRRFSPRLRHDERLPEVLAEGEPRRATAAGEAATPGLRLKSSDLARAMTAFRRPRSARARYRSRYSARTGECRRSGSRRRIPPRCGH